MSNVSTCTGCHLPHGGEVKIDRCGGCHDGIKTVADLANIRMSTPGDFDGNGKEEGLAREIASLQAQLYAAILTYVEERRRHADRLHQGGVPLLVCRHERQWPHRSGRDEAWPTSTWPTRRA